jgi:para-nitrobenzyl esterase
VREWPWSAEDRRLAQAMSSYFGNFAKTGSPNDKDLPQWPSYKAGGNGQVMELGSEIAPRSEPTRARYELFDAIYAKASSP